MENDLLQPIIFLGMVFLLMGVALLSIPLVARMIPEHMRIPNFVLYVYRSGNFYFVTSPLLIAISILYLVLLLLRGRG